MDYKDLQVLYEDNHLLVVVKPQGIPSQADKSGDQDMLTVVKAFLKDKYAKTGNVYVGLVHRLDRPTGGVMVFAKTSKAAARLDEQLRNGDFSKRYLAVLTAKPQFKKNRLIHYLAKDEANNVVRVVPMTVDGAKKAILDYDIVEDNDENGLYLADVKLHTGRSHQIRVQMATIGCPLYGDVKYGKNQPTGCFSLWAYDLSFNHPISGKIMRFRVFPPEAHPWTLFNLERHIGIMKPLG